MKPGSNNPSTSILVSSETEIGVISLKIPSAILIFAGYAESVNTSRMYAVNSILFLM